MQDPLFFIAILPDLEIQKEVTAFKQECAVLFNARHAFKSPPHITLQAPFRWPLDDVQELRESLVDFAHDQLSFTVRLHGFGCFRPRVIFVAPEKNKSLTEIHGQLEKHLFETVGLKNNRSHGFNPHMTIAHRDLDERIFPKAWNHFSKKTYQRQFLVENIVLLRHLKGKWEIIERFIFG